MQDISFAPLFGNDSIFLHEAPGDENTGGGNQTAADNQNRPTQTNTNDQFNINTSPNAPIGGDNDDDPNLNTDQGGGANPNGMEDTDAIDKASVESEEKERDRQIFDTLSPQEQTLKIFTLKKLYKDLYDRCDGLIKKYDTLGVEFEEYSMIIKKSLDTLHGLKDLIADYYENLFDSKSYYQNDVNFNCYLLVLNTIKLTTDDMIKQHKDDIEKTNTSDNDLVAYDPIHTV